MQWNRGKFRFKHLAPPELFGGCMYIFILEAAVQNLQGNRPRTLRLSTSPCSILKPVYLGGSICLKYAVARNLTDQIRRLEINPA
jgi:hypothetical protein